MKLSQMKQLLEQHNLRLTKSLGQNFLHDQNQLNRIIQAAELTPRDCVLEIGPGLGPLTALLLDRCERVLAIEKDARLVEILREQFQTKLENHGGLELVHDDALEFIRRELRDWGGWKVVANLPYSIASPLLVELAQAERPPERMVVTVQHEVARRLVAAHGNADYGVLTLLVQLRYAPGSLFKIPAGCFFPEPEVASACICLVRRPRPLLPPPAAAVFERIVKRAFSQRRKMMLKLLRTDWPGTELERAWAELNLSPQARAETISLEQFIRLTQRLAPQSIHA